MNKLKTGIKETLFFIIGLAFVIIDAGYEWYDKARYAHRLGQAIYKTARQERLTVGDRALLAGVYGVDRFRSFHTKPYYTPWRTRSRMYEGTPA